MNKQYKIIGNTMYEHGFQIGQIVELVGVYNDGVFEVEGDYDGVIIRQDVHVRDLEEV